jgi:hypothetical protein
MTRVRNSRRIVRTKSIAGPHLPATSLSQRFHLYQRLMNLFQPSGLRTKVAKVSTTVNEIEIGLSTAKRCGEDEDDR